MKYTPLVNSLIYSSLSVLFVYVNLAISGMTYFGAIINIIPFVIIFLNFKVSSFEKITLFFIFNILIGPFLVLNISNIGLSNVGRLDYFISNFIVLYLFYIGFNKKQFIFISISYLLIFLSFVFDASDMINKIDSYYSFVSKLSMGFVLFYILDNIKHVYSPYVKKIVLILISLHLFLSFIQLFYPVYLRSGSIEAGLYISGYLVNRPLGFFESSFVYGVNTIFLCYLLIKIYGFNFLSKVIVFSLIAMAFLSTRSALLAFICFVFLEMIKEFGYRLRLLCCLMLIIAVAFFTVNNIQLFLLEQSNSTKLILWYLTLKTFFSSIDFITLFFGNGIDSAALISRELIYFVNNLDYSALYDNRIDSMGSTGFPIHNVYIQILYEHGLFLFFWILLATVKAVKLVLMRKLEPFLCFLVLVIIFQYLLHNDIFSPYLFIVCLIGTRTESNE